MKQSESILNSKKINATAMRMVVLDFLQRQTHALSLTDIEIGIDTADRVTIYRTLKTFESNGLVHSIEDGSGVSKYALCDEFCDSDGHQDIHPHFYCVKCQETLCLPKTRIPEVSLPENFRAMERELMLKGLCASCNLKSINSN